jgi:hypothetical protein
MNVTNDIPRILSNSHHGETDTVHCRVHNGPPMDPILSQVNPWYTHTQFLWTLSLTLSSNLCLGIPHGLFTRRILITGILFCNMYQYSAIPSTQQFTSILYALCFTTICFGHLQLANSLNKGYSYNNCTTNSFWKDKHSKIAYYEC